MTQFSKAVLVQSVEGTLIASEFEAEDLIFNMEMRGFPCTGFKQQQVPGRTQLRTEIVGAPIFANICGPLYGGPGIVRYEDWASYNTLSE